MKKITNLRWLIMSLLLTVGADSVKAQTWVETAASSLSTNDIVVIVDKTSGRAMSNNNGTTNAPTATSVSLNQDKTQITSNVEANLKWKVTVNNGNYQFMKADASTYLYCTNTNNGVRVGTNENKVFTISDNFLKNTGTSRYIGVYNNQDWRCYTSINNNIKDTSVAFYKYSGGTQTEPCATPTFTPIGGSYTEPQNVTISCNTNGATIYYTTDGDDPTISSDIYSSPISVTETTTIKAIAVASGYENSDIATATYTIKNDVAVLPFEWEGGAKSGLLALDGISSYGLGTDYAASNAPYLVKFDNTGDYIQIHTDSQPGTVTIKVKKIGGPDNSKITIQESSDGLTFTDVQTMNINGAQNAIVTLETENAFASTTRYVRILFTKNANVGVGYIKIEKSVAEPSIVAADVELTAEDTSGEISYTINNPVAGTSLTASTTASWISDLTVSSNKVTFTTTANNTGEVRTGTITLTYGSITKDVTVTQNKVVTYTKYTYVTNVEDGETYIIVSGTDGTVYAMGEQRENNRGAVSVTAADNEINAGDDAGVCEFAIRKVGENYTIEGIDGYLYAASSSSNYLKTEPELDEDGNGLWNISFQDGAAVITAQGTYERKVMQYNNSSTLFACYASASQGPVYLFKKGTGTPSFTFAINEVTKDYMTNGSYTQVVQISNMGTPAPTVTYSIESLDAGVAVNDIATLDATTPGKVNFVGIGNVKITATTSYNEELYTAFYTLSIINPNIQIFEKVTDESELVANGEYLIVASSDKLAFDGQHDSNHYGNSVAVTINGIEINNAVPQANVIVLEDAGNGTWYLKDSSDGNKYLTNGEENGSLTFVTTPTEASKWTISVTPTLTIIESASDADYHLRFNGLDNANRFSCYTSVMTFVDLYKKATALADPELSYTTPEYEVTLGSTFATPVVNNPHNVSTPALIYTSSNPSVAIVNASTGAITIKNSGAATITATFIGNAAFKKGMASYSIYVTKLRNEGLIFNETFDKLRSTGGNDGQFTGSQGSPYVRNANAWNTAGAQKPNDSYLGSWNSAWTTDELWTIFDTSANKDYTTYNSSYVQAANLCVKFGAGNVSAGTNTVGTLTTDVIDLGDATTGTLTFSAAGWGTGTNTLTVSATGCTLTFFSKIGNSSVSGNTITLENGVWNDFTFKFTKTSGDVKITFEGYRGFLDEIAVSGPYPVKIGTTGYATLYYGSAPLEIPEGVIAYTFKAEAQSNGLKDVITSKTFNEGDKIAAGTAVVLKLAEGYSAGTYKFPYYFANDGKTDGDNILRGTDVQTTIDEAGYEYFVLGNKDGNIGFYHLNGTNGGKWVLNGAHKAYLRLPEGESILNDNTSSAAMRGGFSLEDMIATAIERHEQEVKKDNVFYNLAGQRVMNPTKGIYIVNGKKVFIK